MRPNRANTGAMLANATGQAARICVGMAGTPEGCVSKKFDVGDKHYLLYKQELSASSPEGTTFGVFLLPAAEYALPLVERLQSPVDTEEDMWRWAEEAALSHAQGGVGY